MPAVLATDLDHRISPSEPSSHYVHITGSKIDSVSLKTAPGPAGVTQRIALWLDEWSMRSFAHDSHDWAAKSEVLRGLKSIGQQASH